VPRLEGSPSRAAHRIYPARLGTMPKRKVEGKLAFWLDQTLCRPAATA
jgi:hypothetical protein